VGEPPAGCPGEVKERKAARPSPKGEGTIALQFPKEYYENREEEMVPSRRGPGSKEEMTLSA